jgi:hypothetical protein
VAEAQAFFNSVVRKEQAFDATIIHLYDSAYVMNVLRKYPDWQIRRMQLSKAQLNDLLPSSMPAAKQAGDYNTYSNVRVTPAGENRFKVSATRYNFRKKYSSPYSALVGMTPNGQWRLFEENVVTQP